MLPSKQGIVEGRRLAQKTPTNDLSSEGFHPSSKQDCSYHISRRENLPGHPRSQREGEMGQARGRQTHSPLEHSFPCRARERAETPSLSLSNARSGKKMKEKRNNNPIVSPLPRLFLSICDRILKKKKRKIGTDAV